MDNQQPEKHQPSLPQPPFNQPGYGGWEYDENASVPVGPPRPPDLPSQPPITPPGKLPARPKELPARYQEPVADMGSTLGYGQTMEFQYFTPSQPTQSIGRLRIERLQQLRQERVEREFQHNPDITTLVRKRKRGLAPPLRSIQAPSAPLAPLNAYAPPLNPPVLQPDDFSPAIAKPLVGVQPAVASAQDTGMIRKVRMGRATFILTGAFIASRVLGLLRQVIFSSIFGATAASDAFTQASLIPDTIFTIVAGGALSSAFIPVFTNYMIGDNDEEGAWHIANTALTLATTLMVILAIFGAIFAKPLVMLYNPITAHTAKDLAAQLAQVDLIVTLMRIMFIQAIVLGSGVIINSVLNAQQDFTRPAIGIALYNLGPIIGLIPGLFLSLTGHQNPNLALYFVSAGIVLAAVLQVGVQIPGLAKVGMHFKPSFDWRAPGILQIGRQMVPRIINASMLSFTTAVDRLLIGLLAGALIGAQTINGLNYEYYQALQLVILPLGIFGQAISTAAFPSLAEYVSRGRMDRVRDIMLDTLRTVLFLSIPSSLGLIILGVPIIQALLQHRSFTLQASEFTAVPLGCFAFGLAGMVAVEILTRAFYAMRDSKTPVIISMFQFAFKIALGIILISPFTSWGGVQWGMGALALSTAIASILEAIFLFWLLNQRIEGLAQRALLVFIGRATLATAGMGVVIYVVRLILDFALNTTDLHRPLIDGTIASIVVTLLKLAIELLAGTFVYLRLSRVLGIEELGPVRRLLNRFKLGWML